MVQMFSWTLGIYEPDLFTTHEDKERKSGKAFNTLLSPTNLMVMCDHRLPDGISSIDQHLLRVKALNTPVSSSDLIAMRDHRSPDGISSIDLILIRDFLRPCAFTSFLQVLDGHLRRVSLWGSLPRVLSEADKGIALPRTRREV